MEHILQFGINIDDERIKKEIYESAKKQIMDDIRNDVKCQIFEVNAWTGTPTKIPAPAVRNAIDKTIETYKDDIIEMAAEKLAERLFKTKKWKETQEEILHDNM